MTETTIKQRLLDQRSALLDLGTRNRLVNVPLRRKGVRIIEIVDGNSARIYASLMEGRSLGFLPGSEAEDEADTSAEDTAPELSARPRTEDIDATGRHRDRQLQTRLAPEGLQKRLFDLWYDARSYEEEQGVNILYLGLGLLRWYEDDKSEVARHAPLILLPVQLQRASAAERFTLRGRGEPASPNLSIQARLRQDFGLEIDDFPDEDAVDIAEYLAAIARTVSGRARWQVDPDAMVLGFFSFAKFLMYRDLDPANWPEAQAPHHHEPVAALLGEGFERREPIVEDGQPIDAVIPPLALNHVLDADSSQAVAIEEVLRGAHLVIKGPPGAGKSQTIANIIAGAALRGWKVLFVAEKMAALDVVQRRLKQAGLGAMTLELHSTKANKRLVLEELRRTRDLAPSASPADDDVVERLGAAQQALNIHASSLHQAMGAAGLTPFRLFGELLRIAAEGGLAGIAMPDAPRWTKAEMRARLDLARELEARIAALGDPARHPWRGVRAEALDPAQQERLMGLLRGLATDLRTAGEAGAILGKEFDLPLARVGDMRSLAQLVAAVSELPNGVDRRALAAPGWREPEKIAELVGHGLASGQAEISLSKSYKPEAWNVDFAPIREAFAARGASWLRFLSASYRGAKARFAASLSGPMPSGLPARLALIDEMIAGQERRRAFEAGKALGAEAFGDEWRGKDSDWTRLQSVVDWARRHRPGELGEGFAARLAARTPGRDLGASGAFIAQGVPRAFAALDEIGRLLDYDLAGAQGVQTWDDLPFGQLAALVQVWLDQPEALSRWTAFAARCRQARESGQQALVDGILNGSVPGTAVAATFERSCYESVRDEFFRLLPELRRFDGIVQDRAVQDFRVLDQDRIRLARDRTVERHLRERPVAGGGIGPLGVLNGEFAKKRNHLPIRQLLDKAGPAIQQLKPVMMMSPLSVSQFLKPGAIGFDLLVIDEASQVEPVDALGAIARARQVVVVGDEKQLPPTRFFASLTTDTEERDPDGETFKARDAESVLDLCLAKGMGFRHLNWHYRSRHQSLIAVSNRQFYENRLLVVPSPHQGGGDVGLLFHHLPQAHYDRGNTRTNPVEARSVAQAIMAHARDNPELSLGVATFSVAQRQAILKELELLRRASPSTEPFFSGEGNEPFFVKNLENIQGDEREVIFISVGYGRSAEGYLSMSFGPLNLDGGERRLNVLISRARRRCEVFSSIRGGDIELERTAAAGVASLKLFLSYAETGRLDIPVASGREPDSLFEEQVAAQLAARGHKVAHQIGSAGFFVDLAVVDPEKPSRYLLGIECDGAQYHASRSARDRDRLRQNVLEAQGWVIHRIWSTDWYLRPREELAKVEAAIERAGAVWRERDENTDRMQARPETPETEAAARSGQEPVAQAPVLSKPYEEAILDIPAGQELHALSAARMADLVVAVVRVEGPVHEQEVVARIRDAYGLARAGTRIREAVQEGIESAYMQGRIEGNPFCRLPGLAATPRDRLGVASLGLRRPDMLPPEEVEAAFMAVIAANYGASREALLTAAARLFGFASTSALLREALDGVLERMLATGALATRNGLIVRPEAVPAFAERGRVTA